MDQPLSLHEWIPFMENKIKEGCRGENLQYALFGYKKWVKDTFSQSPWNYTLQECVELSMVGILEMIYQDHVSRGDRDNKSKLVRRIDLYRLGVTMFTTEQFYLLNRGDGEDGSQAVIELAMIEDGWDETRVLHLVNKISFWIIRLTTAAVK